MQDLIIHTLTENKALNIVNINVKNITSITDNIIICHTESTRHASALGKHLLENKELKQQCLSSQGISNGEWVIMDFNECVVHIMKRDIREFYQLEKLWQN